MASSSMLLVLVVALVNCQDTTMPTTTMPTTTMPATTTPPPTVKPKQCWMDAFPPTRATNDLTCQVCTVIFQGLDDYLLNNEEQIAHALENLCEGFPWLFEVCWRLVEACMDDIIEMIIRDGLNPTDMCEALFLCP